MKKKNQLKKALPPPGEPHSAIICGQTGCGKTVFVLDLIETHFLETFEHIIILCPTLEWNKTYRERYWMYYDKQVIKINPEDRLQDWLRILFLKYAGKPTLYVIDDCSATKDIARKKDMLAELAFSGRHADQTVWILTQKYNAVLKDFREQTKWIAIFHCKDRDSFEDCLKENDVIPTKEERLAIRKELAKTPHGKLVLNTSQPVVYQLIK